jgi:hypothetical protein
MDEQLFSIPSMIAELETRVGLPTGSIDPLCGEQPEWVFVLKVCSTVETVLKSAILLKMRPMRPIGLGMFGLFAGVEEEPYKDLIFRLPLRGDLGALTLARNYGLISKEDEAFICSLASIRNRYAHSILNHRRSILDIISERGDENQVRAELSKLRYRREVPLPAHRAGVDEIEFGVLMFMAGLSGILRPPEVPAGPLGTLFGLPAEPEPTEAPSEDD